jgi:D-tyrosyl-tRNA(Tyr) deacylase
MRAVVQRVGESSVAVGPEVVGRIGRGLLVLLGVSKTDTEKESATLAEKIVHLRVFADEGGRLNRSLISAQLPMKLSVFLLGAASCRDGIVA